MVVWYYFEWKRRRKFFPAFSFIFSTFRILEILRVRTFNKLVEMVWFNVIHLLFDFSSIIFIREREFLLFALLSLVPVNHLLIFSTKERSNNSLNRKKSFHRVLKFSETLSSYFSSPFSKQKSPENNYAENEYSVKQKREEKIDTFEKWAAKCWTARQAA